MSVRLFVGIAALAGVSVCGVVGTIVSRTMVNEVNAKLPTDKQFSLTAWYFPKNLRLYREYRRLIPDGRLLLRVLFLLGSMVGCLIVGAWAIGLFGM